MLFESDISIFRIPLTRILSEKTHQAQSYMMIYAPMFATSIQKWTGVTDLRKGIEKIQKKEYQHGALHLLKGSLKIVVIALTVKGLFFPSNNSADSTSTEKKQQDQKRPLLTGQDLKAPAKTAPSPSSPPQVLQTSSLLTGLDLKAPAKTVPLTSSPPQVLQTSSLLTGLDLKAPAKTVPSRSSPPQVLQTSSLLTGLDLKAPAKTVPLTSSPPQVLQTSSLLTGLDLKAPAKTVPLTSSPPNVLPTKGHLRGQNFQDPTKKVPSASSPPAKETNTISNFKGSKREYAQCHSSRTLGPIPEVKPTTEYDYCKGQEKPITIVTAYNDAIKEYATPILENQRAYAEKHKYCYAVYKGDLAHDNGTPRAAYWSKIVAIWDQWKKAKAGSWIFWMDASAIVTNTNKPLSDITNEFGREQKSVIVTNEPQLPINNAVFSVRKNRWTNDWIQEVWSRCDLSQGGEGKCRGSIKDPDCHFEQESMTGLWEDNQDVKDHTSLISNREMNSFYRFSHHNPDRNYRYLDYSSDDKDKYHWHYGDLICKVTGMVGALRTKMTQFVLDNCIDKACELPTTESAVSSYIPLKPK